LLARTSGVAAGLALGARGPLSGVVQVVRAAEVTPAQPTATAAAAATAIADWDVPGGHFYTQTAPPAATDDAGFLVSDFDGVRLWRDYKDLGGPAQFGFPISTRYDAGGIAYQAMEAAVLRWNAAGDYADVFPVFSALAELQLDDWLAERGVPRTSSHLLEDPQLPLEMRLSWLTNPFLRRAFAEPSQALGIMRYGPPMGEPERFGPFLAQRFEKAVLQLWLDNAPGLPAGTVSLVQVGDLLAQAGLIPEDALLPQPPPVPRPVPQTLPGAGQAPALSFVTPAAGKFIVVALRQQWWYAFQDGEQVYSGPVTTGQPALATPPGRFSVLSRHSPYTMVSPWPPGSPFYYEPSGMTYALRITDNGVFLHDAPWRPYYGPGTSVPHYDPDGAWRTGSHGCINLPFRAAAWLWGFAPIGTPVEVIA